VAEAGFAAEDRELVLDEPATAAGEDRRKAGQTCPLSLPAVKPRLWESGIRSRDSRNGEVSEVSTATSVKFGLWRIYLPECPI